MRTLPADVKKYHQSDLFNEKTVPDRLLKMHDTKANTWAVICVQQGKLEYTILESNQSYVLTPTKKGIVAPEQEHKIKPLGEVEFYIEFYSLVK
ncbi:MAG: DUF1971 domain-containing protein [Bdellovibrionales bacterium]|nr:DUF1971 domain-containing protein [Bdellovibrionales bacterium]